MACPIYLAANDLPYRIFSNRNSTLISGLVLFGSFQIFRLRPVLLFSKYSLYSKCLPTEKLQNHATQDLVVKEAAIIGTTAQCW